MMKEKYITPVAEAVEVSEADVITTSPIGTVFSDELTGIDETYFGDNDELLKLFGSQE